MDRELLLTRALDDGLPLLEALEAARAAWKFIEPDRTESATREMHKKAKAAVKKRQPVKDTKRTSKRRDPHNPKPEARETYTRKCLACGDIYTTDSPFLRRCNKCKNTEAHRAGDIGDAYRVAL